MSCSVYIYSRDIIRGRILYRAFLLEGADVILAGSLEEISSAIAAKEPDAMVFDTKGCFDDSIRYISSFDRLKWIPEIAILLEPQNRCLIKRSQNSRYALFTEPLDPENIISAVKKRLQRRDSKKKSFIASFPFCTEQLCRQKMPLVF